MVWTRLLWCVIETVGSSYTRVRHFFFATPSTKRPRKIPAAHSGQATVTKSLSANFLAVVVPAKEKLPFNDIDQKEVSWNKGVETKTQLGLADNMPDIDEDVRRLDETSKSFGNMSVPPITSSSQLLECPHRQAPTPLTRHEEILRVNHLLSKSQIFAQDVRLYLHAKIQTSDFVFDYIV